MVTSIKCMENKAVTMSDNNVSSAGPPRTLLGEVNPLLTCFLCCGYYIDATTIVECLHSFCRSCIIKHLQIKSYCPVCEMMINSVKPNIKPDKPLQDIVYKLVPGLFQREMERRQQFYASHPGLAASATPEQRGEDTERIIFSPEDVISFSLEYIDSTETDSASSKSSESGNDTPNSSGGVTRRYLQCPAVVNISHLKKFLSMKFDIDLSQFYIDILYKRVPLPDYYTLIDVAYIFNWKRIEPMRFFYQIIDFSAIRNRFGLFGISRLSHLRKRKLKPSATDLNVGSPLQALPDPSSDASSGANSPLPDDSLLEKNNHGESENDQSKIVPEGRLRSSKVSETERGTPSTSGINKNANVTSPQPDEEKSQFLNSFELTAKSKLSPSPVKKSPSSLVLDGSQSVETKDNSICQPHSNRTPPKIDTSVKRKLTLDNEDLESKKQKVDDNKSPVKKEVRFSQVITQFTEKATISNESKFRFTVSPKKINDIPIVNSSNNKLPQMSLSPKPKIASSLKEFDATNTTPKLTVKTPSKNNLLEDKVLNSNPSTPSNKRQVPASFRINQVPPLPKRKPSSDSNVPPVEQPIKPSTNVQQNVNVSKMPPLTFKPTENSVPPRKKPESNSSATPPKEVHPKIQMSQKNSTLKSGTPQTNSESVQSRKQTSASGQTSKPTLTSTHTQNSGDPIKSLFDSCNINIPSSLSITLTDQKIDQKPNDNNSTPADQKKLPPKIVGSALPSNFSNPTKTPSPPVHNFIEILKLPEVENSKKPNRNDVTKQPNMPTKLNEPSGNAKGPVPNLKPLSEAKSAKTGTFTKPQTFQQTFLQSLAKQQQTEKTRITKSKLLPANSTAVNPPTKPSETEQSTNGNPPATPATGIDKPKPLPNLIKSDSALDLSTPHVLHNQLGLQQTKALETMQSIANLVKKQNVPQKAPSQPFSAQGTSKNASQLPLRIPVPGSQGKLSSASSPATDSPRHLPEYFQPLKSPVMRTNNSSPVQNAKLPVNPSASSTQPSPRAITRSPSSSPKLVIACPSPKSQSPEEKQLVSPNVSDNSNQSNQISSTDASGSEPSCSKEPQKTAKPSGPVPIPKLSNLRLPNQKMPLRAPSPSEFLHHLPPQMIAQQAYMRQLEFQNQFLLHPGSAAQWLQLNNNPMARAHIENLMKNISQTAQNPFNSHRKDGKS